MIDRKPFRGRNETTPSDESLRISPIYFVHLISFPLMYAKFGSCGRVECGEMSIIRGIAEARRLVPVRWGLLPFSPHFGPLHPILGALSRGGYGVK